MDRESDEYSGPSVRDQEGELSVTRRPGHPVPWTTRSAYSNSDNYSLGQETRHERSWRNDGVSRGGFGGQFDRNNLTWNRSRNHTSAPISGSWRNVNREESGGARPKESNTSWRRNNWDKDGDSRTQTDCQEASNPRRRADSQGEETTEQPSDTDSRISCHFFRRPGKPRNNSFSESPASIPTSHSITEEETKWRRGQSDIGSGLGKYTGPVQVKQKPKTPPMSEEELMTLLTTSPLEVLPKLLRKKDEWLALLNQDSFDDNLMTLILSVLSCICDLNMDPRVTQDVHMVFSMIESEGFLSKHLTRYLVGLSTKQTQTEDSGTSENLANTIRMILKLLQEFLVHKSEFYGEVGVVLILLEKVVSLVESDCSAINPEGHNYMIQLHKLKECFHVLDESHQMKTKIKARQPPNNFRDIPIVPNSSEVRKPTKPFLRKNIIKGRYQDVEHYLDVQFRLLREDFVAPLREGIAEFLSVAHSRHQDIRVYRNVSIQDEKMGKQGPQYTLKFDVRGFKRMNWGKRFLYGSLVCLTKDKFKHIFCASVADRHEERLEVGLVDVCFLNETSNTPSGTFVMVESIAYFEAYRHVLLGLQQMNGDNFPFERYIVNVSSYVRTPEYLSGDYSDVYDLRSLVVDTDQVFEDEGLTESFINAANVSILDPQSWPLAEALHLDESQKAAVQAALTKEFAIIQGPPGTGKTYIGLKIIELLLYNIQRTTDASPILVVCYTNHALDQFLEGVLYFGEQNLVRVGSRSSSVALEKKILSHLKKQHRNYRDSTFGQKELEKTTKEMLRKTKLEIRRTLSDLACAKTVILKVETLTNFMCDKHRKGFQKHIKGKGEPTTNLLNWLNVVDIEHESDSSDVSDSNEEKDESIDVDDEINHIQQERRLDYEDDSSSSDDEREHREQFDLRQNAAYGIGCKKRCGINSSPQEELNKADTMTENEASRVRNVWRLTLSDRWRLYRLWAKRYVEEQEELLTKYRRSYDNLSKEVESLTASKDLEILSKARLVGMTTTGAARCQSMLQLLGPRIVIVEEAAEVLEAHIITALTAKCQHLILIGDHQQLKPNPTVYRLAKVFNMDTSLFERMINNGVPCQTLTHQHRMRPEISKLMKKHFYKNLHDDESVMGFDDIKGVVHNMFFIDHNQFEDGSSDDSKTKSNQYEAEVLVEFCRYLLHQGYKPTQITILTTYIGQLFAFKKLMDKKTFEGVRVSVVDNFQGEENDIILLSLVRSNEKGSIGFLKTSNRVCVALSRARIGFYCIGNASILRKSSIWSGIISTLEDEKKISSSLPLVCQNHKVVTPVASARDFKEKVQDGGCGKPCGYLLLCDHTCQLHCHPFDSNHKRVYDCKEPCSKLCERKEHACPLKCYEKCRPCSTIVQKLMQECGHVIQVECQQYESITCTEPCPRSLLCGHPCGKACGEVCTTRCTVKVSKRVTKCGHAVLMKCAENPNSMPCTHLCDKVLVCGHRCPKKCSQPCPREKFEEAKMHWQTIYGNVQNLCKENCKLLLPCGHPCPNKCGEPCPKAQEETMEYASGSTRNFDPMKCETITEKIIPMCGHTVAVPCHTDIASLTCEETCNKELSCGHRCTDKCGVPCKCKLRVNRNLPSCIHSVQLPCYQDFHSYQCKKKCQKQLPCGHTCSNNCCEPCPTDGKDAPTEESPQNSPAKTCQRTVRKKFPGCNHTVVLPCYKDVISVVCSEKCTRVLPCGHKCPNRCGDPCLSSNPADGEDTLTESPQNSPATTCQRTVRKKFPGCSHSVVLPCHKDVESEACLKKCTKVLLCGHKCPNRCSQPCPSSNYTLDETYSHWSDDSSSSSDQESLYVRKCKQYVNKKIPSCGHIIESPCYKRVESLVCPRSCEKILKCGHQCANKCGEPCPSEECTSRDDEEEINVNDFVLQKCPVIVNKQLPDCLHFMNLPCYKKEGSAECSNPCEEFLECGHKCPNTCGETCLSSERCEELVEKTLPGCDHKVKTQCCRSVKQITCTEKCERVLPCGHVCPNNCKDPCPSESQAARTETRFSEARFLRRPKLKCDETVEKDLPCGHVIKLSCCQASDSTTTTSCWEPCGHVLHCGHTCPGTCGSCAGPGGEHKVCDNKCGTLLLCGHRCTEMCGHGVCSPHEFCNKGIDEESTKRSKCQHQSNIDKTQTASCNFPCIKKLQCNHFCIGVCGEPCPPVCRNCHKKEVSDKYPPGPIRPKETFIYLEDCGHLCERRFLDEMFAGFQTSGTRCMQIRPALCPKCQTPIRNCPRYEDILYTIKESVDLIRKACEDCQSEDHQCDAPFSFAVSGWMICPEGHVLCQDDASNELEGCILCPECTPISCSDNSSDDMDNM